MPLMIPLVGAKFARRTTSREFQPGSSTTDDSNRTWVYVGPAANTINAAAACTVTGAFAVNNTGGNYTADTAFATGEYGWVRKTTSPL
jgi:hypothetical protein